MKPLEDRGLTAGHVDDVGGVRLATGVSRSERDIMREGLDLERTALALRERMSVLHEREHGFVIARDGAHGVTEREAHQAALRESARARERQDADEAIAVVRA